MEQLGASKESHKRFDKFFKVLTLVTALRVGDVATTEYQNEVNTDNASRNHAFSISEMSPEEKIVNLIGTSAYTNSLSENISKKYQL